MFKNKVVIVTGSSTGIGAGIAAKYAKEGAAAVVLHGRREDALKKAKEQVEKAGPGVKIHTVIGDVTDAKVRENLINETVSNFGRLDILVNNAAIGMSTPDVSNAPIDLFDSTFDVNVRSVVILTQLAIPHLIKTKGNIVNISSVAALKGKPSHTWYCMSKIALDHFTRCLAVELGPKGVRVNSVNPGFIQDTEIVSRRGVSSDTIDKEYVQKANEVYPLRRPGTVDEVADAVLFLSSDKGSFITGTVTVVDGGAIQA